MPHCAMPRDVGQRTLADTDAQLRNWGLWVSRDGGPRVTMPYEGGWFACDELEAERVEAALVHAKVMRDEIWWRLVEREYRYRWARASLIRYYQDHRGGTEYAYREWRRGMLGYVGRCIERV